MALVPQPHLFDHLKDLDEETLIKSRLITVETKAINRLQKRCHTIIASDNLFSDILSAPPAAKDDANVEMTDVGTEAPAAAEPTPSTRESIEAAAVRLADEVLLDFAPLEEALMRIQLLTDANQKEVARYEQKKMQIEEASTKARNDMVSLNASLSEAHKLKQHKLEYDVIATEITSSQNSQKTRQMQYDSITRLNSEIEALEREKAEYGKVWAARRAQFGAIVEALMGMQAQIQEDKEEQERREGLEEDEDEGENKEGGEKDATKTEGEAAATVDGTSGKPPGDATKTKEEGKDSPGDIVMEDESVEDGEHVSPKNPSAAASPGYDDGDDDDGEIEEGEEREGPDMSPREGSIAGTPVPGDASFEEMETDEPANDPDDDMEDDGEVDEGEDDGAVSQSGKAA